MGRKYISFPVVLGFLVWLVMPGAAADNDFYKGKSIRVIVGFAAGGGYDTYARIIARHMGKHIPGNPGFVVDNMDGAGSLIAANYTANKASRDGLTLGVWNSAFVLYQALGDRNVKIKSRELGWIGAPVKGNPACGMMGFTGLTTPDKVLDSKNPIKMGGTRSGATGVDLPKILNQSIGTHFDVVSGYKGTAPVRLAMQSREVQGACWGWESMVVTARNLLDAKGDDRFVVVLVHKKVDTPELKDAAVLSEVIEKRGGKEQLATYKAWMGQYEFQRPMVAPPGVPEARLSLLRTAYTKTLQDPEFLAEAAKSKLDVDIVSAQDIDGFIDDIFGMSPKAKESLAFLVRK